MSLKHMDIVVTVKAAAKNEELRYALRSWAKNMPHRNIVVAGYKPPWVTNVRFIGTKQRFTKYQNSTNNLLEACRQAWVSKDFILMNDDFFIMQRLKDLPVYHRGDIEAYARKCEAIAPNGKYVRGMRETKALMDKWGITNPKSYELHVPMVINRHKFIDVIERQRKEAPEIAVVHKRTLYGNYYKLGGTLRKDVKYQDLAAHNFGRHDMLSTLDDAFRRGAVGRYLRAKFNRRCKYERW